MLLLQCLLCILLCLTTSTCHALLACNEYAFACAELHHQQCVDTDADEQPDTCLCLPDFYLRISSCQDLPAETGLLCVDDNPCLNEGVCVYNTTIRYMSCDCQKGFNGDRCQLGRAACGAGQYLEEDTKPCQLCPVGSYKYLTGLEPCTTCPPGAEGSRQITAQEGSTALGQCQSGPRVDEFTPHYGPVAGGTHVNISVKEVVGYTVSDITAIHIAGVVCTQGNSTRNGVAGETSVIQCATSLVPYVGMGPIVLTIKGLDFESNQNFSYKDDPVISNINSTKTFLKGGKIVRIAGEHLDSVFTPFITITGVFITHVDKQVVVLKSGCLVESPQIMACTMPDIMRMLHDYVPPVNSQPASSQPTQAHSTAPTAPAAPTTRTTTPNPSDRPPAEPMWHNPIAAARTAPPHDRRRRALVDDPHLGSFNTKHNTFWLGFVLDGLDKYRNVSQVLAYGQVIIYPNPNLKPFMDHPHQIYYHDYKFYNGLLAINGHFLDMGASVDDYLVEVGREYCNVSYLSINSLHCVLPATQPLPRLDRVGGPKDVPRVRVTVGNLRFDLGLISYKNASPSNLITIAIILGVLVIVLLVAICACVVRSRRKRNKKMDNLDVVATPSPNLYSETNSSVRYQTANGYTNSGYMQPVQQHGPSLAPLVIPAHNSHRPIQGGLTLNLDRKPSTPSTPGTENVAYELPRHNSIPFDMMDAISEDLRLIIEECTIDSRRLQLKDSIGKGFFGKVYRGLLTEESGKSVTTVAIKTIQGKECTVKDVEAFLAEAIVMKDCHHDNVLSLLGVVIAGNRPFAVLPFMEYGDLKSYITEPQRSIKVRELLGFGVQVAAGMEYLTRQKIVHRDLATRNCMVNHQLTVRIADFGLSRDIYKSDYYRVEDKHRPLPVKWMAIESLTGGVFSSSSDVWSFGVLMWELLTRGCPPYPDIDTFNLKNYLLSGRRLPQPEHAPDQVYDLMSTCWLQRPDDRSTFTQLRQRLTDIVEEGEEKMMPEYLKLI